MRAGAKWALGMLIVLTTVGASLATMQQIGWIQFGKSVATLTPTPTPTMPTTTPTPTPTPTYAILSPIDGQEVRNSVGVTVIGEAKNLDAGETLWIFDEALEGPWRFYFVTEKPLRLSNDGFSANDKPIGNTSDAVGTKYRIVLVAADKRCGTALGGIGTNSEGDRALEDLPGGCRVVDDVTLVKSGS